MNKLLCPITFSLPVDPVIAEDGKVYDRSAIEEWLKKQRKSPVTNLAMGTKLLPAPQVTGMIRTMVIKGALTGDKVDAWRQRMKEKEEVEEMRCLAEASNGGAMCNLGHWYKHGEKGLAKDEAKAFEWFEKSHEAGNVCGSGHLGRCYLLGYGVPTCQALDQVWRSRGATLLSEAAGRGSKRACFNLGLAYAEGLYGFPKDEKIARRYYSMVARATIEDCSAINKEAAATWLREHPAA